MPSIAAFILSTLSTPSGDGPVGAGRESDLPGAHTGGPVCLDCLIIA